MTLTEQADKVLKLMEQVMNGKTFQSGSAEKEFYSAVWGLCQQLKDADAKWAGSQMVPSSGF